VKPNPQQQLVIDHFDGPCLVTAVPGAGKTASVTERIKKLVQNGVDPRSVLAITFTNKAAAEMKSRVALAVGRDTADKMTICTFHSLCARIIRHNAMRIKFGDHELGDNYTIYDTDDQERLLKTCIAKIEGEDFKPGREYIKCVMGYLEEKRNSCLTEQVAAERNGLEGNMLKVANEYLSQLIASNALDFTGLLSETLRLFVENPEVRDRYRSRFKYISVDEMQDTNVAQYEIIKQLGLGHKNVVVVGDYDQCIPGSEPVFLETGEERPIKDIAPKDRVRAAAGRGNTVSAVVRRVSNKWYSGKLVRITTAKGKIIRCTPNHVLFGMLNALPGKHFVYLMYKRGKGYRIGRAKGERTESTKRDPVVGVKVRINQEHGDSLWVLRTCESLGEAAFYEAFYAFRYGIPTICFHDQGRHLALSQKLIDDLYASIDSASGAERLMADLLISEQYPHLLRRGEESTGRPTITLNMFGHKNKPVCDPFYSHIVTLHGESESLKHKLEEHGIKVAPSKRDMWRVRRTSRDYATLDGMAKNWKAADESLVIVRKAVLTETKGNEGVYLEMPASHFMVGMSIAVHDNGRIVDDLVEKVEEESYDGIVYDLKVENVCNFVANGVVCHNSIYAFRGAFPENIMEFEKDFGAKMLKMETNYRSTPSILHYSQKLIERNTVRKPTKLRTDNPDGAAPKIIAGDTDEHMAALIADEVRSKIAQGISPSEIAVFYRVNSASRVLENAMRDKNIKYVVVGGLSFWHRKEVKIGLALLKLLANDHDRMSFEKVCENCCKGAGGVTFHAISEEQQKSGSSMFEASKKVAAVSKRANQALTPLIKAWDEVSPLSPGRALLHVSQATHFWGRMRVESTDTDDRCENISEMAADVDKYCSRQNSTLSGYLQTISLLTADDAADSKEVVKLMTLHGCKGLEFDAVMISHCTSDMLPHARGVAEAADAEALTKTTEEERRLLYVGMTRARKHLALYFMRNKLDMKTGRFKPMFPSKFLRETGIPTSCLYDIPQTFDE
jgi:DNA helicase-2/ATP-dependent DNA helicase PcrA